MLKQGSDYTLEREKALAEGLRDVASELRLIDAIDLVTFIRAEQFGNIKTLVNSSTELFFRSGTISFGLSGDVDLRCPNRLRLSRIIGRMIEPESVETSHLAGQHRELRQCSIDGRSRAQGR